MNVYTYGNIAIPNDVLLVTADVAWICPSIFHEVGLKGFRNAQKMEIIKKYPLKTLLK